MRTVVLALAAILTWRLPHVRDDVAALQSHDLDGAVGAAASLGLITVGGYLLVVILASWRARHSRRWAVIARRCAPAVLRACITAGLAAGIATAPPASAMTESVGAMDGPHDVHGLEFPDRPMSPTPPPREPEQHTKHTVRPDESLWSIAADTLPADAGSREIDRAWRAWWRANRSVIGPDPDVIHPGQVLHAPTQETP